MSRSKFWYSRDGHGTVGNTFHVTDNI